MTDKHPIAEGRIRMTNQTTTPASPDSVEREELIRSIQNMATVARFEDEEEYRILSQAVALLSTDAKPVQGEDEYFAARPQIDSTDRRNVFRAGFAAALLAATPAAGGMTPEQINEVNNSLWQEIDEIKEKIGYNEYHEANRGTGHWTLLGYLMNLKHRAADNPAAGGGEAVIYIPRDALMALKPPRLIVTGVPLYSYEFEGSVAVYTHPQPSALPDEVVKDDPLLDDTFSGDDMMGASS